MSTIMNEKVGKTNYFSQYLVIYSMLLGFTTMLFVISFFVCGWNPTATCLIKGIVHSKLGFHPFPTHPTLDRGSAVIF